MYSNENTKILHRAWQKCCYGLPIFAQRYLTTFPKMIVLRPKGKGNKICCKSVQMSKFTQFLSLYDLHNLWNHSNDNHFHVLCTKCTKTHSYAKQKRPYFQLNHDCPGIHCLFCTLIAVNAQRGPHCL